MSFISRNNFVTLEDIDLETNLIGVSFNGKYVMYSWVDVLVNNILEDLEYCIEVEGQELPIPAILNKCKISSCMSKEDSDKVVHALKIKGVIAKRHTGINDDYFVVEDFL